MADGKSAPSIGETVAGNYRILGTAGAGGMGVVYRALDLKLQRTVALKFLPSELNDSERDKERFLKEARTASSLDHPNVGVIYGIEETPDDRSFIAMAYYEGSSLAQRIRNGPLAPAEAAEIAIQVLRALEHAHLRGIEHRDVKPSNIMLTGSAGSSAPTVKLVDFGLAHVSQQTATKTHGISGTVAYMSPEQTLGQLIDTRSDIWAAGVVLVEMLTGRNPFARETIPATIFAIINEPPVLPDAIPAELQRIVYHALSKDPVRRYQSCSEMLRDLEAIRPGLPGATEVQPSAAPKSDSKPSWSIRDSIDLRRSREYASVSSWGRPPARSGRMRWIIGVLAMAVFLGMWLVHPVRQRIVDLLTGGTHGKPAQNEVYLAALGYMQRYDKPGNIDRAIDALQGALKSDPLFALGYAQLGEAYRMKYQTDRNPKWLDLAVTNCEKAEELDNRIPGVYTTLALIHNEQGKQDLALQEFNQALEINPRNPDALRGVARFAETAGQTQQAEEGYKKAAALRPDDWAGYSELGGFYQRAGRFPEAIAAYRRAVELSPDNGNAYNNLGTALLDAGDPKLLPEAEQLLKKSLQINPSYPVYTNLADLYLQQGRFAEAIEASKQALALDDNDYLVWDNLRAAYEWTKDAAGASEARQKEIARLEQHLKSQSSDAMAHALLASLWAQAGDRSRAQAHLQTALALDPKDANSLEAIADAYASLGERALAVQYMRSATKAGATEATLRDDPDLQSVLPPAAKP
jgi:serine/threonine-protein kinase